MTEKHPKYLMKHAWQWKYGEKNDLEEIIVFFSHLINQDIKIPLCRSKENLDNSS